MWKILRRYFNTAGHYRPGPPVEKENSMDKKFMVILWNGTESDGGPPHKIEEFETLRDAVTSMVKNGALFEHQEIVQKVDWMPGEDKPATSAQPRQMTPEEEELAKRPNPTSPPPEQPKILNDSIPQKKRRSIFDGVIPPQMIPMVVSGD